MEFFSDCTLCWSAIILALLVGIYLVGTWNYGEFKKRGMAYSKPIPYIGAAGPFLKGKKSHGELSKDMYNSFKGHRAFGFFNFLNPIVVIRDPEVIRLIAVKDFEFFTDHIPFIEEEYDKLFGKSLFCLKGDRWRSIRATLSPAFTSSKMKGMYTLVDKCGEQLADYLQDKSKDSLFEVEAKDLFTRYTNDVIATAAYGIHCDSLKEPDNEFYKMGLEISHFGGFRVLMFLGYILMPKIMMRLPLRITPLRLENFFCSIIKNTMETREREKIIRPDMIHLLMQARKGTLKEDGEDGKETGLAKKIVELSDDDVAAQAFIFFIAGFDTSSTLLTFLSYQLAVHPEIQEKVQQEIDEVLAATDGVLSYDAVQKMKYLDTVISETLRLWPPIIDIDRGCLRDYVIPATESAPAIVIKKGDGTHFPVFGIHHDPEYWPEPERFDPDRFSDENKHNIKPFTYMPFGTGPRACIGNRFALMEAKIAMANVLAKVTLEVTEKTPIPIRMKPGAFNLAVEGSVWLGVKPRACAPVLGSNSGRARHC